ncbi:hypothetical protein GCM10023143_14150 [Compostibacter hankyongensis]|uniref:DUF4382 domain-containing protein n=2 Tax=Compostibacter hankyongensis TaxID=1007089 RepID=A0ABP8FN16_9BACT
MVCTLFFTACERASNNTQPSRLSIYLTDGASRYSAVWIDLQKLYIVTGNGSDSALWDLPLTKTGAYNLVGQPGGTDTLLTTKELPATNISKVRLVLGNDNKIVLKDGSMQPLVLPGGNAQETVLDLKVNLLLSPGGQYELVLDINLPRSIIPAADSSSYSLNPVIRTFPRGSNGKLSGTVAPAGICPQVLALTGNDTLLALPDSSSGNYLFPTALSGTYELRFMTDSLEGYRPDTLGNIQVTSGNTTEVDTMFLQPVAVDSSALPPSDTLTLPPVGIR